MISIASLYSFSIEERASFGHNGYVSHQIYRAHKSTQPSGFQLSFQLEDLSTPYRKNWDDHTTDFTEYARILSEGHSFGAWDKDQLIGVVICEARPWNNTLYIENIQVAEQYRKQGVGSQLLKRVIAHATPHKFRHIELETQNTNLPAISFYQLHGFEITGFNLTIYDGLDEFAFYMTRATGQQ